MIKKLSAAAVQLHTYTSSGMEKLTRGWLEEKIGEELGQTVGVVKFDKEDDPKGYLADVHNIQVIVLKLTH